MLWFLIMSLFSIGQSTYLTNGDSTIKYMDTRTGGAITVNHQYPYVGFGCSLLNEPDLYFITASNYPVHWIRQSDSYKCNKPAKKVEVMKYNNTNYIDSIITTEISDYIVSCGIDKKSNILYYISANYYNCPSSYNLDSSITRIDLNEFKFMDKTILRNIPGVPTFSIYSSWYYKYIHSPSTSINIDGNSLWLGFGGYYTGIWRLNITSTTIKLIDSFQKIYYEMMVNTEMGIGEYQMQVRFQQITKSFYLNNSIYFIDDSGYRDAKLMKIDINPFLNDEILNNNNTNIITLDGINYISDIEINDFREKIYIVTGLLNSELYQFDYNFNKISLSANCNIDFLKFPTEWGVITNIILDKNTGFLYSLISLKYGYSGIVKISTKDLSIDMNSYKKFGIEYNNSYINSQTNKLVTNTYFDEYSNMNITLLVNGKLYILPSSNYNRKKMIIMDLYGCSIGFGFNSNTCEICKPGKYSDQIGTECRDCNPGFSSDSYESIVCKKCIAGKFTTGTHNINCLNCDAGKYAAIEGSSNCISCKKGKYSIISASKTKDNCLNCEDGKISDNGMTSCTFCEIGEWAKYRKKCIGCSNGKYSISLGLISSDECLLCPIGKYSDEIGLSTELNCKICMNGKIGIVEGAVSNSSCINCEAGQYKKTLIKCNICPDGWISMEKSNECTICPIGKISDTYSCNNCSVGKYNDLTGLSSKITDCKSCNPGMYSSILGATDINFCIKCPSGKYNTEYGLINKYLCISCTKGKYRNDGQDSGQPCKTCSNGKYSLFEAGECKNCIPGKYSTYTFSKCFNCPSGKYNILSGQHTKNSCILCPAGKWSERIASNSSMGCILCNTGLYSETKGATSSSICKECPEGKYNENRGVDSMGDCKECSTGSYSTSGSIECILCDPGKFNSITGSSICKLCEEGKYTSGKGSFICTDCPPNSEQNYLKDGCICSASSYNSNESNIICSTCSDEFICDKGTKIKTLKLKEHYWRQNEDTIKTYKCKNIYACKGGLISNSSDDLCQEGHKGPLCDVCEKGWAKDDGVCLKCPDNATRTIGLTIFIPLVCIFLIMFLIKTANPSDNKKEEINGVVKIFMNYAQVFSLASSFQINWPLLIRYLFERAKEFSSPRVSFYSSDCAIGWSYYDKLIVYLALPLFYMIIVTIIIALISLCYCSNNKKKLKRLSTKIEKQKYIERKPTCKEFFTAWEKTAIVVGTFLSWPTIVEKTLEVMNCEKIGDIYYLVKDVSVICYDSKHYQFLIVSYIAIIIYGIGIPLSGFYLLYKYRYRLYDMQNRYDGSTPLSFLFLGYREKRWYYEFIIMGKKAGLILLSVFLKNYPRYQIIGASLLVQISFFLHVFLRPYDTITSYGMICNKLESISLLSLVMTLSTGLFFGTIDSGYQLGLFEDILIVLLILSNGGIVFYFFVYFLVLGKKTAISHLRDSAREKYDKDKKPCFVCCCNEDRQNSFKEWVYLQESNNYGIHLENDLEKQIFSNYFKEKKSKLNVLNDKIDKLSKRRVSVKLDKIRSEIQVMEKQRCWQTIQNNRLYGKLKKIAMVNKIGLNETEINELNDVFKLYVKHGVKYNDKMNDLYMGELKDMVPESPIHSEIEMTNQIILTEDQISRMSIENSIII